MRSSACSQVLSLADKEGFQESSELTGKNNTFCACFLRQVALHACGVATDMVMEHCIQAGAAFVVSPCCYGFVQNAVKFTFPKRFVPQPSVTSRGFLLFKMLFLALLFSCQTPASTGASLPSPYSLLVIFLVSVSL